MMPRSKKTWLREKAALGRKRHEMAERRSGAEKGRLKAPRKPQVRNRSRDSTLLCSPGSMIGGTRPLKQLSEVAEEVRRAGSVVCRSWIPSWDDAEYSAFKNIILTGLGLAS